MKKIILVTALIVIMSMISGCAMKGPSPVGVSSGFLYSSVTYPTAISPYGFARQDIEILGNIKIKTLSYNIAGLVALGGNGYNEILSAAKTKYPDAEGLINVYYDLDYMNFLFLFSKVSGTANATVIKLKK